MIYSYNFAAGSFHTEKLCSRPFSREVEFYWHKQRYGVFVPPFGGLKGKVHGSTMARWKARGRLPISANWTFFASYHGWGTMSRYWSKSLCSKGGRVTFSTNFRGKWASPTNEFWREKTRVPGLSYGEEKLRKISTGWIGRTNVTDRRQTTDGIAIAYSEPEHKFTFAKKQCPSVKLIRYL